MVGQLFGFVGLFVAVPILSLIIIAVEEFWVKPIEEGHAEQRRSEIELPQPAGATARARPGEGRGAAAQAGVERQTSFTIAITIPISTKITIRICMTIQKRGSPTAGRGYSMMA